MQFTSNIDMTLPFWGLLIALFYSCYYIIQMKFEQHQQSGRMIDMNKKIDYLHEEIHELKKLIIKSFTTEI